MGIVFGLGIMYLLSRVMQTSRRIAVMERQLKQNQMKTEDVDVQLNYLLMKAAQPPVHSPPSEARAVEKDTKASPQQQQPPSIPFPAGLTFMDMSPEMLMPPGLMNLFCGVMDDMDAPLSQPKRVEVVEEVVEPEGEKVEASVTEVKVDKTEDAKGGAFIDNDSESESEENTKGTEAAVAAVAAAAAAPRKTAGGRGGGRGRAKKV